MGRHPVAEGPGARRVGRVKPHGLFGVRRFLSHASAAAAVLVLVALTTTSLIPARTFRLLAASSPVTASLAVASFVSSQTAFSTPPGWSSAPPPSECAEPRPEWIWCDDFEEDRSASYFEIQRARGRFVRALGPGVDSSWAMVARWDSVGQVRAGALLLAFGRTPDPYFRPVDGGREDYRDVYWRVYVRHPADWEGGAPAKLSRATVLATPGWAQAMIAHVWSGGRAREHLVIDPASGTDEAGALRTTGYNDTPNLRWLGARRARTPIFADSALGRWYCVEAHVRLNRPGRSDGVFELWIDDRAEARRDDLNWVGAFHDYGINAVFFENYWNRGAPRPQERYFDNIVVSKARIGCGVAGGVAG